jgi:hypothetical protein
MKDKNGEIEMNTEKKTWKFWIMTNDEVDGRYYYFRSFKVYWAYYKWLYSKEKQLEKVKSDYEKCTSLLSTTINTSKFVSFAILSAKSIVPLFGMLVKKTMAVLFFIR